MIAEVLTGSYKLLFLSIRVGIISRIIFSLGEGRDSGSRSRESRARYRRRGSSNSSPLLDGSIGGGSYYSRDKIGSKVRKILLSTADVI